MFRVVRLPQVRDFQYVANCGVWVARIREVSLPCLWSGTKLACWAFDHGLRGAPVWEICETLKTLFGPVGVGGVFFTGDSYQLCYLMRDPWHNSELGLPRKRQLAGTRVFPTIWGPVATSQLRTTGIPNLIVLVSWGSTTTRQPPKRHQKHHQICHNTAHHGVRRRPNFQKLRCLPAAPFRRSLPWVTSSRRWARHC